MLKIVVISPHPDDESLGAGGLLHKHKQIGDEIYWINITDVSIEDGWSAEFVNKRSLQIRDINEEYGFDGFFNLKYVPSKLDNIDNGCLITDIGRCLDEIKPDWIILPNPFDAHTDHRVVYEATMSCAKTFRRPYIRKILVMEVLSETEFDKYGNSFSPNYFVDISAHLDDKIRAVSIYDTEIGTAPFPRNIEAIRALALLRGGMAGCLYAEAYRVIKEIEH